MKMLKIMQKNIKILFRSSFTSFMVLFGPLAIILVVGLAMSNFNTYKIKVGTYSDEYSALANQYLVELSSSNFKITKYSSEKECIDDIKFGGIHTCLIFPKNFEILSDNNTLKFYVDPTNVNLVWMVTDEVSKKIESGSSKVSLNITEDIMSRVRQSINKSTEISGQLSQISVRLTESQSGLSSAKETSSGLELESDVPSVLDLNIGSIDSATKNLYDNAITASNGVSSLVTSIQSSAVWNQLNSTQKSSLTTIMNSAKTSAESLRSTITTKYNDTTKKTSDVLVKMSEMETVLVELEDSLSELSQKKSTITTELASVSTKLSEISVSLSQSISLGNEVISILSGIRVSDAKSIVSPVATQIIPIKNDSQGINFMFPALLVLIIMFISLLLSSLSIVMEKNSRAYFRNFVTPTGDGVFLIASFLTNVFIQILQLVMVLVVTYFVFDKSILGNIITTVLILLMAVSFFVVLGMIVGYMFSSEEAAILGTISISSVLFFLSNIVMPLDALPESIKFFVDLNPFIIVMSLLRRSLLFNITYIEMYENLLFFGAYLVGAFVILFIMHKFMKLKFFYHNTLKNKKIESTANIPHGMKNQVVSSDNLKK